MVPLVHFINSSVNVAGNIFIITVLVVGSPAKYQRQVVPWPLVILPQQTLVRWAVFRHTHYMKEGLANATSSDFNAAGDEGTGRVVRY